MATFSKFTLSGSISGKFIPIAGAGTTIHTSHATSQDEVWIWINNNTAADIDLTLSDGTNTIVVTIASKGTVLVIPGTIFFGTTVLTGTHGGGDGDLSAFGYVNRIA